MVIKPWGGGEGGFMVWSWGGVEGGFMVIRPGGERGFMVVSPHVWSITAVAADQSYMFQLYSPLQTLSLSIAGYVLLVQSLTMGS